ncbi:outer membrane protein with beta-barrel domain [Kordia periserrulae]|uniref:Outer membrane protein with beta-barrel domain n=1 Tax=Kordia periserrulae TaxID=701523 RepID=A0A2T6C140_9FLAO|nr:outer membrane beta-barrel protein [Kordia periserrulae]PTX62041.1 outer membrane protein with beta-barrel domain [Kordia periserrulae]
MKNYTSVLLLFFLMTSASLLAQINFEKGYFITENGQKTECYIKNEDWINTPSKFEYKLTQNGETKILRIPNLKTVVIENAFKFEKHTVPFDNSDRDVSNLKFDRTPDYEDTTLLLNVLLEGKVDLYAYRDQDKKAFYFKKENGTLEPLIYNVYTNENRDILYNKRYQQQLLTEFPCTGITERKVIRVDYKKGDLLSFFKDYSECKGETAVQFSKPKKGTFHIKVFAGAYNTSATTDLGISAFFAKGVDTEATWSPTFGAEFEYIFPFNKNKWSAFIAANYSSYEGEGEFLDLSVRRNFKLEYSAIQIPIGARHYMFLNDTSKLFLSGAVVFDILLDAKGSGNVTIEKDDFGANAGLALGLGYSYDKYSIEARYLPGRNLLDNGSLSRSELKQFSITIGYTIF